MKGRKGSKRQADGNMEESSSCYKRPRISDERQERQVEGRNYFFTWNNYQLDDITNLITWFKERNAKFIFQEEKGHGSGTPHLQGHVCFRSSVPKKLMDKKVPWCEFTKNIRAATAYCSKLDTRAGKVYCEGFSIPERLEDELEGKILYEFQRFIIDLYELPRHQRRVYWLWNKDGDIGKTSLLKSMISQGKNVCFVGNSTKHAAQTLGTHIDKKGYPKMVFVNLARGVDANYQLIERIKDGCIHCDMYDTGAVIFNRPHVIVFANAPPREDINGRVQAYEINDRGGMLPPQPPAGIE